MKTILAITSILLVLSSCGDNTPKFEDDFTQKDKYEINKEKSEIDDLFYELKLKSIDENRYDLTDSYEMDMIQIYTDDVNEEISNYAKSIIDSIDVFLSERKKNIYKNLFAYAENQGWNKLDSSDFKQLEEQIKVKSDEFSRNITYKDRTSPKYINQNGFYLFYFKPNESSKEATLMMKVQYYDDNWLFIEDAKISIDGEVYFTDLDDWGRGNSGGMIYEWSSSENPDFDVIIKILESKKSKIRFFGSKYYDDRTITNTQKSALKRILKAFYGLYVKDKVKF